MKYALFLDDERFVNSNPNWIGIFIIARNFNDFVHIVNTYGLPEYISFDHDLGAEKTGYDCAKWLVDYVLDRGIKPKINFYVHSQNPVGRANIEGLLNGFNKQMEI